MVSGSLVPEEVVWISAVTDGRVEKIFIQPGTLVRPDTVIMELSNPTLSQAMMGAEFDLKQAEANLTDLSVNLQSTTFDKQAAAAQVTADYNDAKLAADRDQQLAKLGLIPDLDVKLSQNKAQQLGFVISWRKNGSALSMSRWMRSWPHKRSRSISSRRFTHSRSSR